MMRTAGADDLVVDLARAYRRDNVLEFLQKALVLPDSFDHSNNELCRKILESQCCSSQTPERVSVRLRRNRQPINSSGWQRRRSRSDRRHDTSISNRHLSHRGNITSPLWSARGGLAEAK